MAAGHSTTPGAEHSLTAWDNDDDFEVTKCGLFAHFCFLWHISHTTSFLCRWQSYSEVLGLIDIVLYKKLKQGGKNIVKERLG